MRGLVSSFLVCAAMTAAPKSPGTLVASSATVATLRGYPTAPYLWIGGVTLASATALFRISQDEHRFT